MNKQYLCYLVIRTLTFPFGFMPYKMIHFIGKVLGYLCYYLMPKYRKRALSNLALASDLNLSTEQIHKIAKESFVNLIIVCLEYAKFEREKDFSKIIICKNPEIATKLYKKNIGIIFFCAHQANWEALFLDGTTRMQGLAIGKPIKNPYLYKWIKKIREKNEGKITEPKSALKHGLKALRNGVFLGILGDQGMPTSGFSSSFLGKRAYSTTAPALLACRTNSPIIFASIQRTKGKYYIHYSDPIFPDPDKPVEQEVKRLTCLSLSLLEDSIKKKPNMWLWQHNRWKQLTPKRIYKRFRHDCICIILPKDDFDYCHLNTLLKIYEGCFVTLMIPKKHRDKKIKADEILYYENISETMLDDYRFKLVFNFTSEKRIKNHYLKKAAFEVISLNDLKRQSCATNLSIMFKQVLCRPGTI